MSWYSYHLHMTALQLLLTIQSPLAFEDMHTS